MILQKNKKAKWRNLLIIDEIIESEIKFVFAFWFEEGKGRERELMDIITQKKTILIFPMLFFRH